MLARESLRSWSIALGLSALIHFGLAGMLSGQSWTRDLAPVLPVELIESTPIPREEPRPAPPPPPPVVKKAEPPPVRTEAKVTPPPPPQEIKPLPAPEPPPPPPPPDVIKKPEPVMEAPSAPPANTPPAPTPPRSPAALADKEREATRGVGPSVGEAPKSSTGDAPPPGSPSGVASLPRAGTGPSSSTSGTGTSSGTGTRGITQWAHPRGGYQVQPSYPPSARKLGIQGTVRLKIQVLADGHVGEIVVEVSAGHPDLDRAAADAVRQWHFEPARKGSEPVATWVLLPVQFQLK